MRKVGRFLDKLIAYLGYAGIAMAAAGVVILTLMITLNVIMRYFFNRPLKGVDEVSAYLFVMMSYLGFAYAMRLGRHINVDLVTRQLPRRANDILEVVTSLIGLAVIAVLFRFAWKLFMHNWREGVISSGVLGTPLWIPQSFLWIGLTFLGLEIASRIVKKLLDFRSSLSEGKGEKVPEMPGE